MTLRSSRQPSALKACNTPKMFCAVQTIQNYKTARENMAGKFDAFELMKVLPGVTLSYSTEDNQTVCTLIPVHYSLKNLKESSVEILLQKDPEITCSFRVKYYTECNGILRASIRINSMEPYTNLKYKAALYFNSPLHSKNFTFLEDLILEKITEKSFFYFSLQIENVFYGSAYCYLLFQISRKDNDFTPMQVENPESEIRKDFSLLLKNKLFTDVKIICQDQEFSAHKGILVARSPVFQAMFEHKMKESQENEIKITDIEPAIIEHLLKFIYTDTVEDLKEAEAKKLLAAADKYALENLKLMCMKEISKSVRNVQEGFDVVVIAEKYNVPGFRDIVLDFARKNPK